MINDDAILAAANRALRAKRESLGLDPDTGEARAIATIRSASTVPAIDDIRALIAAAVRGRARLNPGREPKRDASEP